MKKIIALSLVGLIGTAALFTACGGSPKAVSTSTTEATSTTVSSDQIIGSSKQKVIDDFIERYIQGVEDDIAFMKKCDVYYDTIYDTVRIEEVYDQYDVYSSNPDMHKGTSIETTFLLNIKKSIDNQKDYSVELSKLFKEKGITDELPHFETSAFSFEKSNGAMYRVLDGTLEFCITDVPEYYLQ